MAQKSLAQYFIEKLMPARDVSGHDVRDRVFPRYLIVAMQAVSVILTWNLWSVREFPPNLPLITLPDLSIGWALIGSLLIIPWRPMLGISLHTIVLVSGVAMDQMRIQPEFISLTILMWGTLPCAGTILLSRTHLFSLWFFAGFHKLLSPEYFVRTITHLSGESNPLNHEVLVYGIALAAPVLEISIVVLMIPRRTRKAAALLAFFLHAGILLYLLSISLEMGQIWNSAVWPWNVALACVGWSLIADWKEPWIGSFRESRLMFRVAACWLVVMPIGYYFGVVDAYLAHCLYSGNVPIAWYRTNEKRGPMHVAHSDGLPSADRLSHATMKQLNVPFPPAHRLYEHFFRRIAKRGDSLYIRDPRAWAQSRNLHDRILTVDGEYRDGKKHGFWILRYDDGKKMSEGNYFDGLEQGPWMHWFPDGRKECAGVYHDGKMEGRWRFWFDDGRQEEAVYEDGKLIPQHRL